MYKVGCVILSLALITVSALYWRESMHNEYHISKMNQFEYISKLNHFIGKNIQEFQLAYPKVQCEMAACVLNSRDIEHLDVFKSLDTSAIDFFGIELVVENGIVTNIRQYKP